MAVIEATQAGVVINNSNSLYSTTTFTVGLVSAGVGSLATIFLKFGDGFIKEFFQNREDQKAAKRKMADQLTSFCVEAEVSDYHSTPDERHIKRIADDIDSLSEKVGNKLRGFLNMWGKAAGIPGRSRYRYSAKEAGRELREIAKEWKK